MHAHGGLHALYVSLWVTSPTARRKDSRVGSSLDQTGRLAYSPRLLTGLTAPYLTKLAGRLAYCSHSVSKDSRVAPSVELGAASVGTRRVSSSSIVAGARTASRPGLSAAGRGSRRSVWSASHLGARSVSASVLATGEVLAWPIASRTAASASLAASSRSSSCK